MPRPASGAGVTLNAYVTRPRSRGTLRLRDARPDSLPIIDPNYLSDPGDLRLSVETVKTMREIMRQPVWAKVVEKEHLPGDACRTDAEIAAYVRRQGRTCYHPVGACRMDSDARAVVDPALRVRGIEALRVADSSIMPSLVISNTNAPTMMIAEKAADLIRGNRIAAAA